MGSIGSHCVRSAVLVGLLLDSIVGIVGGNISDAFGVLSGVASGMRSGCL